MDDPTRRRRRNDPPTLAAANPRYVVQEPTQQHRPATTTSTDRYRPPATTSPSTGRSIGAGSYGSDYYPETGTTFSAAMPQNALTYPSDYGQDGRQSQSFASYTTPSMMYPVPQTAAQSSVYDATQQFSSSRQSAPALGMINAGVGSSYFGETADATVSTPSLPSQAQSTNAPTSVYSQVQLQGYGTNIPAVGHMAQESTDTAAVSMAGTDHPPSTGLEEKWSQYQGALRGVFQDINGGALDNARQSLLTISTWLLSQVVDLGLNQDDQNLYQDRIKLWNDFNHAWLALLQRQKDMMENWTPVQRQQSAISKEELLKMGKELVRLCDGIERHGLVDYQYGVWEEQILMTLEECLDQYEATEEVSGTAGQSSSGGR